MKQVREDLQPPAGTKPRRRVGLQALLTLILVTVVFGGLELVVRIRQSKRFGPRSFRSIALRDRFSAWRNNPAYGRVDRHINAQGFRRDQDVAEEKPPHGRRIFVTGGSVAYGWTTEWPDIDNRFERLDDDQTVSYYLEQMLNAAYPAEHWEVINAAVVGYQLNLELAQTQSVLLRYRPDYIVYLDGRNDLLSLLRSTDETYDPYASTPTLAEFNLLANPGSFRSGLFFLTVWMRENSAFFRALVERAQSLESPPPKRAPGSRPRSGKVRSGDLSQEEFLRFRSLKSQVGFYPRLARQIQRVVSIDGARAIFLLPPELSLTGKVLTEKEQRMLERARGNPTLFLYAFQELYPEISAGMKAAGEQEGFVFENLQDVFDKTSEQTFTDDCHLTPEGNRLVAARVAQLVGRIVTENATPAHRLPPPAQK
jgi:hypothetical protein